MRALVLAVLLSMVVSVPSVAAQAGSEALVSSLRTGGHVLFIPHTRAGGGNLARFLAPPDCPPGTNLTPQGWRDAMAAGSGLLRQGVLVEEVYASPVCATRHTAYLLFGADKTRLETVLTMDCAAGKPLDPRYAEHLNRRLAKSPPHPMFNVAVVGHVCGLLPVTQPHWPACARQPGGGDVVVFTPVADGYRVAGCIPFAQLEAWSRAGS